MNLVGKRMKAAVLEAPQRLVLKEVPIPQLKEDEVLVKVGACGICGSDVRYYFGENPWALHTLGKEEEMPPNVILGHEISGDIVEVGSSELKDRIGKRVGIIAFRACGTCYYCRKGLHNLCANMLHIGHDGRWRDVEYVPGGFAEYVPVWNDKAHIIPSDISYEEATQLDGLAVAVHATNRGNVRPGDSVMIIGQGAIGLMTAQVVKVMGATTVIAVDIRDKPLDVALRLGVDHTLNSKRDDVFKEVMRLTNQEGVDVVFDTVGSKETVLLGLKSLARGGRLVLVALSKERITIDLTMLSGERVITSSANNLYYEYTVAVKLLSSHRVQVRPFITHVFNLDEIEEAFKVAINKDEYDAIKVVVKP
ncbi:MAG: hypothetical protein DRZ82_06000 [Thermoprotei archaeon]|nr:MAG: hypothetical protein DRZ82_06000 [Thermoprotei archaeon]